MTIQSLPLITVQLTIPFESLVAAMISLSTAEKTQLMEILEHELQPIDSKPNEASRSFQRGWEDAMTGKVRPIEGLWDRVNAEQS